MLYQLSYASNARNVAMHWSGRRESNPQPTAWKAVTLPLSYSRASLKSTICKHSSAMLAPMAPFLSLSSQSSLQHIHCLSSALQRCFGVDVLIDIITVLHL